MLLPALAAAQPYPRYNLEVFLDNTKHKITGLMTVRLPDGVSRPAEGWWFHLPPNRFADEDPRGSRQSLGPSRVGFNYSKSDPFDPAFPNGFSPGRIEIVSVLDDALRELTFTLKPNPGLPPGDWRGDALMYVEFAPASSRRQITIQFVTHLPNRYVNGWHDAGVAVESWHPVLLNYRAGRWVEDVFDPVGAQFDLRVQTSEQGWLVGGFSEPRWLRPNGDMAEHTQSEAMRRFPLIFLTGLQTRSLGQPGLRLRVFFREDHERIAELALRVGEQFAEFMQTRYGLSPPRRSISMIQSDLPTGKILSVGDAILISTIFFKNNPLLDRVFVANLSRVLAEMWFGQEVWANRDTQTWLHLGLTGYLSIEFFRFLYGPDAGIHDVVDWLNPKYREHYFETKVVELIRTDRDLPLAISLRNHPDRGRTNITLFQKAPLVMRSLAYVMGERAFKAGLVRFYQLYRLRAATSEDFREVMEEAAGQPLGWFFAAWYHGTTKVDYALGDWSVTPQAGGYRVSAELLRLEPGIMPVELLVKTEGGGTAIQRWDGKAERTVLEFDVSAPVEGLVLDPQEFLLETDRQNNQSFSSIRWRPFYDWSKQRETLVTFLVRLGGNAIDGNTVGIGSKIKFNEDHNLFVVPIFAENTSETLYQVDYVVSRVFLPRLTYVVGGSKLGGRETFSTGFSYKHDLPYDFDFDTSFLLSVERVSAASLGEGSTALLQQPGQANNISIGHIQRYNTSQPYVSTLALGAEHSQPGFGSDFRYTSITAGYAQDLGVHANHTFRIELLRGLTSGDAPIQKQHLLGDPLALRGFPRTVDLVSENIAVLRTEYHYVVSRHILGETVQTRKLTLILFADIGKGWNNDENFDQALTRKDVGLGVNLDLSTLSMLHFPLRVEVAYPIDDPVYKNRQVILFQVLAFF
ncbi:MAG: M1 family aminopeptidase [SAR324 cluster bacterium]|nr:M1 family aminopeptidase [SAR324 cluster bacterium]